MLCCQWRHLVINRKHVPCRQWHHHVTNRGQALAAPPVAPPCDQQRTSSPLLFISIEMYSGLLGLSLMISMRIPFFSCVEKPMMMCSSSVAMLPVSWSKPYDTMYPGSMFTPISVRERRMTPCIRAPCSHPSLSEKDVRHHVSGLHVHTHLCRRKTYDTMYPGSMFTPSVRERRTTPCIRAPCSHPSLSEKDVRHHVSGLRVHTHLCQRKTYDTMYPGAMFTPISVGERRTTPCIRAPCSHPSLSEKLLSTLTVQVKFTYYY